MRKAVEFAVGVLLTIAVIALIAWEGRGGCEPTPKVWVKHACPPGQRCSHETLEAGR